MHGNISQNSFECIIILSFSPAGLGSGNGCSSDGERCRPNAECIEGSCRCISGYLGDGEICVGKFTRPLVLGATLSESDTSRAGESI